MSEKRTYLRHPVDIPIQIFPQTLHPIKQAPLRDVGKGGLAFRTNVVFEPGAHLIVRIDHVDPVFEAVGVVRWTAEKAGAYEVGVEFLDDDTAFQVRMVEQVCQIQKYHQQCIESEGQGISYEQSAKEWIERFGSEFGSSDGAGST